MDFVVIDAVKKETIRALWIFLIVALVFLFLRIIYKLIGVSDTALFSFFIYDISTIFLLPFFGIFPNLSQGFVFGQSSIDVIALIALFSYTVIDLMLMAIVQIIAGMLSTQKHVEEAADQEQQDQQEEQKEKPHDEYEAIAQEASEHAAMHTDPSVKKKSSLPPPVTIDRWLHKSS